MRYINVPLTYLLTRPDHKSLRPQTVYPTNLSTKRIYCIVRYWRYRNSLIIIIITITGLISRLLGRRFLFMICSFIKFLLCHAADHLSVSDCTVHLHIVSSHIILNARFSLNKKQFLLLHNYNVQWLRQQSQLILQLDDNDSVTAHAHRQHLGTVAATSYDCILLPFLSQETFAIVTLLHNSSSKIFYSDILLVHTN